MFAAVSMANDLQSLTRLINPLAQLRGNRNENKMFALIDFLIHGISFRFRLYFVLQCGIL